MFKNSILSNIIINRRLEIIRGTDQIRGLRFKETIFFYLNFVKNSFNKGKDTINDIFMPGKANYNL